VLKQQIGTVTGHHRVLIPLQSSLPLRHRGVDSGRTDHRAHACLSPTQQMRCGLPGTSAPTLQCQSRNGPTMADREPPSLLGRLEWHQSAWPDWVGSIPLTVHRGEEYCRHGARIRGQKRARSEPGTERTERAEQSRDTSRSMPDQIAA
jgi:hypothetical protein